MNRQSKERKWREKKAKKKATYEKRRFVEKGNTKMKLATERTKVGESSTRRERDEIDRDIADSGLTGQVAGGTHIGQRGRKT